MNNWLLTGILIWMFIVSYFATTGYLLSFQVAINRTASPEQVNQINQNTGRIEVLEKLILTKQKEGTW